MLNVTWPESVQTKIREMYIAPSELRAGIVESNKSFNSDPESRLDILYSDEIVEKIERLGFCPEIIAKLNVLEVCAGPGFLSYHFLKSFSPKSYTVNDISQHELNNNKKLLESVNIKCLPEYIVGDLHEVQFPIKYDLIIGNSFLHHFYDVPTVMAKFYDALNDNGAFISLHEPTTMATAVEGKKKLGYILGLLNPKLLNYIARRLNTAPAGPADLWLFDVTNLNHVAYKSGFKSTRFLPWSMIYTFFPSGFCNRNKAALFKVDSFFNRFLPARFFGSISFAFFK